MNCRRDPWATLRALAGLALASAAWVLLAQPAQAQANACSATLDASTVYSSADAQALRDAVAAAGPGDVVRVAGVCAGVSGAQVVAIGQPLTLRGGYTTTDWTTSDPQSHPTIVDAQQAGRGIYATQPVTLENLIVQNGRWTGSFQSGGGVAAEGAAVISNTIVRWSEATNGSGGGLYVGGPATVTAGALLSNTARYRGGGAYFNTTAVVSGSAFIGNSTTDFSASFGGGANFGFNGPATVIGSRFEGNTALISAGGARFDNRATLHGVTFTHNAARAIGGAIFSNETHAEGVTFSHNQATLFSGGGAEFTWITFLTDVTFYSNTAGFDGGGANFNLSSFGDLANLRQVRFIGNTAGERGGGAYARSDARLDAEDVTFSGNQAGFEGGGLFSQGQTRLAGAQFQANQGRSGGGAFFAGAVTLTHASFVSNAAQNLGGGAAFGGAAIVQTPITFTGNAAGASGGGAHVTGTLALSRGLFARNSAGQRGGGLAVLGSATLVGLTFDQNQALGAQGWGGGAYLGGPATLSGTQFTANAARHGGGAYLFASGALTQARFISNTALANGGGAVIGGSAVLSASLFMANSAGTGGPFTIQSVDAVEAPFALFALNGSGGGVLLLSASMLAGSDFLSNTATEHGGGIFAWGAAQGERMRLRDNRAGGCGGGLHLAGMTVNGRSQWVNSMWAGNSAPTGAAVCAAHDGNDDALGLLHVTLVSPTLVGTEAVRVQAGAVHLTNTLIASHTVGLARQAGLAQVSHVLIAGAGAPLSGTVMLAGPLFGGPVRFVDHTNYHLAAISPAVDGGAAGGPTSDYFGALRPQGGAPDIGYAESPYHVRRTFIPRLMR